MTIERYKPTMSEGLSVGLMGHCVAIDGRDQGREYSFEVGFTDDEDRDPWVYLWQVSANGRRINSFDCNPQYFGAHHRWARRGLPL